MINLYVVVQILSWGNIFSNQFDLLSTFVTFIFLIFEVLYGTNLNVIQRQDTCVKL